MSSSSGAGAGGESPSGVTKVVVYSAREYDISTFNATTKSLSQESTLSFTYREESLNIDTANFAEGADIIVAFVNDDLGAAVLEKLSALKVKGICMRCAGANNVDAAAAARLKLPVLRVPAYSPSSVAEHAVALLMAINRKIKKSIDRTRHCNFDLSGLVGRDIGSCIVGIVGTGRIGLSFARIMHGFGAKLLALDVYESPEAKALGITYVSSLDELLTQCDVISLHCNLTPENTHMFNAAAFDKMKRDVILINTARGGLIDTIAAVAALKSGHLGGLGIDVVEEESNVFFRYREKEVPDVLARLLLFSNVLVTGHQAFLTNEALAAIASTTIANIGIISAAVKSGGNIGAGATVVVGL